MKIAAAELDSFVQRTDWGCPLCDWWVTELRPSELVSLVTSTGRDFVGDLSRQMATKQVRFVEGAFRLHIGAHGSESEG